MKTETLTPKMQRQRKFLLALPLLALPFLTLFFWALGGGKAGPAKAQITFRKGFNTGLPGAKLKDNSALNKMSYYNQAEQDSVKLKEQIKSDPYYHAPADADSTRREGNQVWPSSRPDNLVLRYPIRSVRSNSRASEAQVYQKLAQIQTAINQPSAQVAEKKASVQPVGNDNDAASALKKQMEIINQQHGDDPEMAQMNGLLEKVLDIQHPDRVNQQLKEASEKHLGQVFAVSGATTASPVSFLSNPVYGHDTSHTELQPNSFFALDDAAASGMANAIRADVYGTQTLVNGSVIKLRLVDPVFINGVLLPKDNFVFGMVALNGERLTVKIGSIRHQNSLFPVALTVYDMDGLEGIEIPGAISRNVAKESAASSVQGLGMTSFDPSFGAQAAGAGIEAAKTLFSTKVKLVKVTVKAGYQILLKDEKAKQNNSFN